MHNGKLQIDKKITKYSSFKSENFKIPVWTEFLGQTESKLVLEEAWYETLKVKLNYTVRFIAPSLL